jgi:hypothetical protein
MAVAGLALEPVLAGMRDAPEQVQFGATSGLNRTPFRA